MQWLVFALTEVGERVLELVHKLYKVGIHACRRDWPILCKKEEGERGEVVVRKRARVAVGVVL